MTDSQTDGQIDRRTHGENIMSPDPDGRGHRNIMRKFIMEMMKGK